MLRANHLFSTIIKPADSLGGDMKSRIFFLLLACFSMVTQAADLPNVVNENEANDQQACIANAAADCINEECPNSESINCTDNCQTAAQDRCKEKSEE